MSGICKQGQPLSLESIKYRQVMKPDCPNKDNQAFLLMQRANIRANY